MRAIRSLGDAGADELAPLSDPARLDEARSSPAALLVSSEIAADERLAGRDLLVGDHPKLALGILLPLFHPPRRPPTGAHPTAVIGASAKIDPTASIGPYSVVGEGSRIGPGAVVHAHVVVGRDCAVGAGSVLHPSVVLYDGTTLGERVIVHAGTVLGSDGFGYHHHQGVHRKVPQVGRLVIEDDVEIGANSAVDRAALETTRIGRGTKVDNLVQVGHNVEIGRACILVGQSGVAGSSRLGDGVVVGGQSGVKDHVELGDGARVAAASAVFGRIEAGQTVAGVPAVPIGEWRRWVVASRRLGELLRRLRRLERKSGEEKRGG